MESKKVLEKFINDNFDLTKFYIKWESDFLLELTDLKCDKIALCCVKPYCVWTSINGEKYLNYRLGKYGEWVIDYDK